MSLAFVISLLGALSQAQEGGESMAMDGFGAAESLYQQDPEVWGQGTIKTRRCVEWYEEFLLDIRERWEDEKCVSIFQ